MKRVKEIREKQSDGSFTNSSVPIGTDGLLVDMLSGLDNEQELKLGGNHSSVITEVDENTTTVVETFKDLTGVSNYVVETTIAENLQGYTIITSVLKKWEKQNNEDVLVTLKTKTINIPPDAASITIGEVLS